MTDAPKAATITHHVCDHGTLHVQLRDAADNIIATAAMDTIVALNLSAAILGQVEAWAKAAGIIPDGAAR